MTTFSYTTGNPTNLTGGATASMNDIQGPFTDLKTFLNGGNLDYSNLATATDSYYKTIRGPAVQSAGQGPGTYVIGDTSALATQNAVNAASSVFYLNSSDYPAGTRSAKLRLAASAITNAVAPGITYTYGLYPVTASAGAAGFNTVTFGVVVAGSTVAIATPALNTLNHAEGSDFTFPASGYYGLGVVLSGVETASAAVYHRLALQFRAV